jgi:hypothetical protein
LMVITDSWIRSLAVSCSDASRHEDICRPAGGSTNESEYRHFIP